MQQETVKHLELIHAVIVRMILNSFLSKVLTIIVSTALFALAAASTKAIFVFTSLFPAIAFWGLDAYPCGKSGFIARYTTVSGLQLQM